MQRLMLIGFFIMMVAMPVMAQDDQPDNNPIQLDNHLTVWLPAPLIDDLDSDAYQQLLDHTLQFVTDTNISVDYRIKDVGMSGGIMSTIRAGSVVAPGALPDVTLIRRSDLATAQAPTLLQSMEGLFSSALINDLDLALELGQVTNPDGITLYGLPYFVEVMMTVSPLTDEDIHTILTFDDILEYADQFLFPAGRATGLNQTFYLQYLAAGGIPPRNGEFIINANALQTVLEFYETAIDRGIISSDILNFNSPSAYRTEFINAMDVDNFAIFSSSEVLTLLEQEPNLRIGTIPTSSGEGISTLGGWVWVMVSPDPAQQDLVARYLNWMMQPNFHAELAATLNELPAQKSAIEDSLPTSLDLTLVNTLLTNAILPLPDSEGGTIPRAMQEALIDVISGETSAEIATNEIITQFGTD